MKQHFMYLEQSTGTVVKECPKKMHTHFRC